MSEGAALLAHTGDSFFVSYIRKSAERVEHYFNEFGLWHFRASPLLEVQQMMLDEDPRLESKSGPESESEVEGGVGVGSTSDVDRERETTVNATSDSDSDSEFGLDPELKHEPSSGSESESESKPDTQVLIPSNKYNKVNEGRWELVASRTEEEVLDALGVEFVEPELRNCEFVVGRSEGKDLVELLKKARRVRR